jgi:hypothetical protein
LAQAIAETPASSELPDSIPGSFLSLLSLTVAPHLRLRAVAGLAEEPGRAHARPCRDPR